MADTPHYISTNNVDQILPNVNETMPQPILHGAVGNITTGLLWGTQINVSAVAGKTWVRIYGNPGPGAPLMYMVEYDLSVLTSASNVLQAPVPFGAQYSNTMAWTLQTDAPDAVKIYRMIFYVSNLLIT
tara:strand:- start:904 stop:1290 length:387 start_codon:yes stop_codon:yes gene_type:complete